MGSGSDVVGAVTDPVNFLIGKGVGAGTGDKIKTDPGSIVTNELYDKPKQAAKDIQDEIKRSQAEADAAEAAFQKEQSAEKKKARDLALQNLQRSQARLQSLGPQKGGYSGTILTSPLGVVGDTNGNTAQKTLLGY